MRPEWQGHLINISVAIGATAVLLAIRAALFRLLGSWCEKNKSTVKDVIVKTTRVPSIFWCISLGLLLGVKISGIPERFANPINTIIQASLLVSLILVAANLLEALLRRYLRKTRSGIAESGLIRGVVRTFVFGIGALTLLSHFGIQIGPLLTALGVGGLAFALAFKDTVENMFSGIHLLMDKTVEVGDLIKLESGQEGIVKDIGWRTSKISLDDESLLIIPNMKLAQNITIRKKKGALRSVNQVPTLKKELAKA